MADHTDPGGFRRTPQGGPQLRADIVDVSIFRRGSAAPAAAAEIEFLQLLRAGEPMASTWQPIMGHIEAGETAVECALREMTEEVGLDPAGSSLLGLWALEQVHPYFIAAIDAIVLSPRFAAEVSSDWRPRLNSEHSASRWVPAADIHHKFMWPGQVAACREILEHIVPAGSPARQALRIR